MHPLIIQDLNFLEEQSCQPQIVGGGLSLPKVSTSVSTSLKVKSDVNTDVHVSVKGLNYTVSAYSNGKAGAAASGAVSASLGGTVYTSTYTNVTF